MHDGSVAAEGDTDTDDQASEEGDPDTEEEAIAEAGQPGQANVGSKSSM